MTDGLNVRKKYGSPWESIGKHLTELGGFNDDEKVEGGQDCLNFDFSDFTEVIWSLIPIGFPIKNSQDTLGFYHNLLYHETRMK